jgi:hypothetical protein
MIKDIRKLPPVLAFSIRPLRERAKKLKTGIRVNIPESGTSKYWEYPLQKICGKNHAIIRYNDLSERPCGAFFPLRGRRMGEIAMVL